MKTKILILLLCALPRPVDTYSQHTIRGKVTDDKNSPLEWVNIALLNADSVFIKGTTSDIDGAFELKGLSPGDYFLNFSSVGYRPLSYAIAGLSRNTDWGTIPLEENTVQLEEVSVAAAASITKADRKILFPSREQLAASTNGITLLASLSVPRLMVDMATSSVSLPGNEAVELRINNVVAGKAEILALPPRTIERIEYIDNPGLRYGDARAVLNYIVRSRTSGGTLRMDLTNSPLREYGEDLLAAKINHRKSEFGISLSDTYQNYYHYKRNTTERFSFDDHTITRNENGDDSRHAGYSPQLVLNYNFVNKDQTFVNVSLKHTDVRTPHEDFSSRITLSSSPQHPVRMKDYSSTNVRLPSLDLYVEQSLAAKQKLSMNVVATGRHQNTKRSYEEEKDEIPFAISSDITSDAWSVIAEGIYENELEKGQFNAGIKHFRKWTDNNYRTDLLMNSSMQQSETNLYAEFSSRYRRLNYTLGIGGKRSWFHQDGAEGYTYYNLQPTINLSYNLNDKGALSYRLRIYNDVPPLAELTDAEVAIDSFQVRRGNPSLKPGMSYNNTVILSYPIRKLSLSLYATHWYSTNFIREKAVTDGNLIVRTYQNAGDFHRIYVELSPRLLLLDNKLILQGGYGITRFTNQGDIYIVPNYFVYAGYSHKEWNFYAQCYNRGGGYTGETKHIFGIGNSIGLQYRKGNYIFGAGASNLFIRSKTLIENISPVAPYSHTLLTADKDNLFFLKFAVNLDFGRKFNSGQQKISNSDSDSNVLEAGKR
jgi:hypothetical protein